MDNIIYIDDYINLYNKKNHKLIIAKPYKNTLRNGFVIDKDKFIKKMNKLLENNNLKNSFFNENITIVINNLYKKQDKIFIKEIIEELDYKNIKLLNEIDYLKIDKKVLYINCNKSYFYFLYTNCFGDIETNLYKNDNVNKSLVINIIKHLQKEILVLYGKNYLEISNILQREKIDYYFFEDSENLIIQILLNSKKV
ncbi:MAG: hypothetical protein E7161_02455 [Firmicutes bacterium]|nr:hypothetical protein [Bacillota bacterium]